jgi:iron complex transport system substrate-binding protein
VGSEQKYDVEKIISMKPDAIFTNHIASFDNTYQLLKNNGIQVIFWMNTGAETFGENSLYQTFRKILGKEKRSRGQ